MSLAHHKRQNLRPGHTSSFISKLFPYQANFFFFQIAPEGRRALFKELVVAKPAWQNFGQQQISEVVETRFREKVQGRRNRAKCLMFSPIDC